MPLRYQQLFETSPNAYMVLDRELRFVQVNRAYELLTGLPRAALIGHGLFELFPGTDNEDGSAQAAVLRSSLERVLATGERDVLALIPYAIRVRTPQGEDVVDMRYWSATHTPVHDEHGAVVGVMQHTSDVTEAQALRQAVRDARELAGLTQEQAQQGMLARAAVVQRDNQRLDARNRFLTDLFQRAPAFTAVMRGPDYVFEMANPAYQSLMQRTDLVGRSARAVFPDLVAQGFFDILDEVRASGVPFVGKGVPARIVDAAGGERTAYVDFINQPMLDAQGRVDAILVHGHEVTERFQAMEELRAADERKNHFLAMLAHELRNPLTPITTAAYLLRTAPQDIATVREVADIIERQAEHMRTLVEDLLDVSRVTRGEASLRPQQVSLAKMVGLAVEQVRPLIDERRHALKTDDAAPGLQLQADPTRLVQIIGNLLNNAAKYTPPGGRIHIRLLREDDVAVVEVADNGNGMVPELIERAFELFGQFDQTPQRHSGGLGLGLSLSRSLAALHGGSLTGHSDGPGQGATFRLRMPLQIALPETVLMWQGAQGC